MKFRSVGAKIQLLMATAFLIGLTAVLAFQTSARLKSAWQERLDANLRIVHGLAAPARGAIQLGDKSAINSYMELLTSDPRAAAVILTSGQKVMASQQSIEHFELPVEKLAELALEVSNSQETRVQEIGEYEFIAVPIKDAAFRNIGSIAVAWSVRGLLDNVWQAIIREALALFAVGIVVILVLMSALRRLITKPLTKIAGLIERNFAVGTDDIQRAQSQFETRDDEIGTFARALGKFYRNSADKDILRGQLENALTNMTQGLCMMDKDGQLVISNARFWEMYDLPDSLVSPGMSASDMNLQLLKGNIIAQPDGARFEREQMSGTAVTTASTFAYDLSDGRSITISRQPTADGGWVMTHTDVTDLRAVEKQLLHLARHDSLTDLPNRRRFIECIEETLRDRTKDQQFAVLFLDLDRFKLVNDTLGHAAGDELLKTVSSRLLECVSDQDVVCRLGGDEFAILQRAHNQPTAADQLAIRVTRALSNSVRLGAREVNIGVSTGIALAPKHGHDVKSLLKSADIAVYQAKSDGRNTFRFFDPAMAEDRNEASAA